MEFYQKFKQKIAPFIAARKSRPVSDTMSLNFKSNDKISIGVEMEMQIVDKSSMELREVAKDLIHELAAHTKQFVPEFHKPIIEVNSTPHDNIKDLHVELDKLLTMAEDEADKMGCALIGGGSHPFARYADVGFHEGGRYDTLLDKNQWLSRRWLVNGMHIHLGMKSSDECVRFMHFFEYFIPHFLALSASSPFWQELDTGFQSARGKIAEGMPTSDLMYTIETWSQLQELVEKLRVSESIGSLKDLHWDIRPSPAFGTLELRIFDMPTNLMDAMSIAAFVHSLAIWFSEHAEWLAQMPKPQMWKARQNKWRAIRYGLGATIIQSADGATSIPLKEDLNNLFDRVNSTAVRMGYSSYIQHLKRISENGSGTDRLRQVYENTGNFREVVRHAIAEFKGRQPIYPAKPAAAEAAQKRA